LLLKPLALLAQSHIHAISRYIRMECQNFALENYAWSNEKDEINEKTQWGQQSHVFN